MHESGRGPGFNNEDARTTLETNTVVIMRCYVAATQVASDRSTKAA